MSLPVQKLREAVFQLLYSVGIHPGSEDELIEMVMHELKISKKNALMALETVNKIRLHQSGIDALIKDQVKSYELERIDSVERTILGLALYECVIAKQIPIEIAITEAKRLVRKFGNREAEAFVQAIIDAIYKQEQKRSCTSAS